MLISVFVMMVTMSRRATCILCNPDMLSVYNLQLTTLWDQTTFPKQYPQWRPPAQWSTIQGYTHGSEFSLFEISSLVSPGVKQFVETGDTDLLEKEDINRTFLDKFSSPPISSGVGNTSTRIFIDGNNTKVSLISKLIPSPDWFIGLNSLDLCQNGKFIDKIIMEAEVLDAGTDNGFTFTSPNWPTEPQGMVFKITSQYPTHPASSFHYPHLPHLPNIAFFTFTKEREYQLRYNYKDDKPRKEKKNKYEYKVMNNKGFDSTFDFVSLDDNQVKRRKRKLEDQPSEEEINHIETGNHKGKRHNKKKVDFHSSTSPQEFLKKKYSSSQLTKVHNSDSKDRSNNLQTFLNSKTIQSTNKISRGRKKRLRSRKPRRKSKKKKRHDCRVSKWSEWGGCSKSCGIGERLRTRTVKKQPRQRGQPCPPLKDIKWCGSAKNCNEGYFDW